MAGGSCASGEAGLEDAVATAGGDLSEGEAVGADVLNAPT